MLRELLGVCEGSLVNRESPDCSYPETLIFIQRRLAGGTDDQ
ncbi:hypothetical protein ES703_26927 [subsurface metagenome]